MDSRSISLLGYAFEVRIPLSWLVHKDMVAYTLNIPFDAFSRVEAIDHMRTLFAKGFIILEDFDGTHIKFNETIVNSYLDQPLMIDEESVLYKLTSSGGQFWEQATGYDWNTY